MQIIFETNAEAIAEIYNQMLEELGDKFANKALRKALKLTADGLKADTQVFTLSDPLKKAAKRSIGYTLKLKKAFINGKIIMVPTVAKVGFGVGKRSKSSKTKKRKKPGVGISKNNIHWFVLGTQERKTQKGYNRGRIKPIFKPLVPRRIKFLKETLYRAMNEVLREEIQKLEKKGR